MAYNDEGESPYKVNLPNKQILMAAPVIIGIVILVILVAKCAVVVPAGHVGLRDLFGNVSDNSYSAGFHLINPLATLHKLSVRTQELKEVADVPSKEGLMVRLEVSLLYRLNEKKAADVFKKIGPNYENVIIKPQLRSSIRGVTASYAAKALYTAEREAIATEMHSIITPILGKRGIIVEQILLRSVTLPLTLSQSIEKKLEAEQQAQQMEFVLDKEKREADRKRIEARGISDFQRIVSKSINENLLRWKGIEATEELSKSNNAKIVVIGGGKDGLPLILGGN